MRQGDLLEQRSRRMHIESHECMWNKMMHNGKHEVMIQRGKVMDEQL